MKYIKYFEENITKSDVDDIKDLFQEFIDEYYLIETPAIEPQEGRYSFNQNNRFPGGQTDSCYSIWSNCDKWYEETRIIIDIFVKAKDENRTGKCSKKELDDIGKFVDRVKNIGYDVSFKESAFGFLQIIIT